MLEEKLKHYNVILASNSPRRQELLKKLGIPFSIETKEVKEIYPSSLQKHEITDYLSKLKSDAFTNLNSKDLLITSDTIVWLNNKALGKPKNKDEAFSMLKDLSNKEHSVYTSVCIKSKDFCKIFNDETIVKFRKLSEQEINYYLETYQPYDKAGSYGVQDWLGLTAVEYMKGSYFTVMGLPVHKLYKELMKLD